MKKVKFVFSTNILHFFVLFERNIYFSLKNYNFLEKLLRNGRSFPKRIDNMKHFLKIQKLTIFLKKHII
jgi:hypothetical protein